jgi:hypothetical protein
VVVLILLDQPKGAAHRLERPDRVHQIEDLGVSARLGHDRDSAGACCGRFRWCGNSDTVFTLVLAAQDCDIYRVPPRDGAEVITVTEWADLKLSSAAI